MKLEDMDLSELPQNYAFTKLIDKQFYLWEMYNPTTIEADIPFEQDWWKFVYWMPKIKKDFYTIALSSHHLNEAIIEECKKYGMDTWFFYVHYKEFVKRLEWMRKQGINHIGEAK